MNTKLSPKTVSRIEQEALAISKESTSDQCEICLYEGYKIAATNEATRAHAVVEAAKGVLYSDGKIEQREVLRLALQKYTNQGDQE